MKQKNVDSEENPFSLSIGDLMAATLFIFVLLLAAAMLKINQQTKQVELVADQYQTTKKNIVIGLQSEFGNNLDMWEAELDTATLCIRFQKEEIMFDNDQCELKPEFKQILNDFFPRYLKLLKQYKDEIEEIRIEGHTSSVGSYYHNMELSQARTRIVLEYCESLATEEDVEWMRKYITANGLSYSHPVLNPDGTENETRSRRVEFRVITKADSRLEQIVEQLNQMK